MNPFRRLLIPTLALLVFSLVGCQEGVTTGPPPLGEDPLSVRGMPHSFGQPAQLTEAERSTRKALFSEPADMVQALSNEGVAFHNAVTQASDWQDADRRVRELLQKADAAPIPRYMLEQIAASEMFDRFISGWTGDLSERQRQTVGFYTRLLAENRSPESPYVLAGLTTLEGHWADSKIAAYAQAVSRSAKETYGNEAQTAPTQEVSGSVAELDAAKRQHMDAVLAANKKLDALSDRLSSR
jgi:hypothetical protein